MFHKTSQTADVDNQDNKSEVNSEIDEELHADEDFRKCGEQIKQCLYDGIEIPDQLYVDIYVAKLRITYDYKNKKAINEGIHKAAKTELDLTRQLANLQEELAHLKDPTSPSKKKKRRTIEVVDKEIQ